MIISCTGPQTKVTLDDNKTKVVTQENINPYQLIIGKWKMISYQVFSPDPDPTTSEDIFWEFKDNGEIIVNSYKGKSASENSGRYWMNKSILNVDHQLYMYYFKEPLGIDRMTDAKPFGDELWLDINIDPSISDDGPKIHFERVR